MSLQSCPSPALLSSSCSSLGQGRPELRAGRSCRGRAPCSITPTFLSCLLEPGLARTAGAWLDRDREWDLQHGLGPRSQQQGRARTGMPKHREALAKSHRPAVGIDPFATVWEQGRSILLPAGPACGARQERDSPSTLQWDRDLRLSG